MRLLVISSMFPCKRNPVSAVFFADLMKEFSKITDELIVVTPRVYIPRFLKRIRKSWKKWDLDPMVSRMGKIKIIRPYVPQLRGASHSGINAILMYKFLYGLIRHIARAKKIQMILGHNMLPEGVASVKLAGALKLPGGFWAIGSDVNDFALASRLNYRLSKECIAKSGIIFTTSKALENRVKSIGGENANVHTFYKGINLSEFLNLPGKKLIREKLGLEPEGKYMLFAGRLIREKGIYELADAFAAVQKKYDHFKLIFAGEELEKPELISALEKRKISGNVIFTGIVPHGNLAGYMKASDLLVLPTWAEGLPNVVIEAMACGLPVVTTDVGGIPEILENGVTGLMVPARDTEKLAKAIFRMIEDPDLREECVKNARELVIRNFDVRKNVFRLGYELCKLIPARSKGLEFKTNNG